MRRLAFAFPVLFFVPLAACSPATGNINVTSIGTTESSWSSGQPYVLATGEAGALTAAPTDANGNTAAITVSASVDNAQIAQVYTTSNPNTFVVVGASVGTTSLRFSGGGDPPEVVVVNVVGQ